MSDRYRTEGRLRVLVMSFMFSPLVGGSEIQAEKHARQLQALGHDVTIITVRHNIQWKSEEILNGLLVRRVGGVYRRNGWMHIGRFGHPFIDLALFVTLWRMRHQFDVIHAMQLSSIAAVATLIGMLCKKKVIISIQSAGPDEQQQQALAKHGAWLMADTLPTTCDLKVAATDWVAGDIANLGHSIFGGGLVVTFLRHSHAFYQVLSTRCHNYLTENGFRAPQIFQIPNGIDIARFKPAAIRPNAEQPERDILCVARLEYPKGVDVLLHAWARMMREPAEWRAGLKPRLRLVGQGIFQPQMQRMVAELGIEDSVEFLGLRHDIVELLQQAWGFVLPSRWEGMPNALLEAMSCGLPCLATRVSGSEDIITDGINGLLVPPEQPAEMALALRRLLADQTLAEQMAHHARETIVRDYNLVTIAERSVTAYRQMLDQKELIVPLVQEEMRKA